MKKILALMMAVLLLLLCGCGPNESVYKVQCISAVYDSDATYPQITVLHNTEELQHHFPEKTSPAIRKILQEYDTEFFQDRILFVLTLSLTSSSDGYELDRVNSDGTYLTLYLKRFTPSLGIAVMGATHMLIEMDKSWDCAPENIKIEYE